MSDDSDVEAQLLGERTVGVTGRQSVPRVGVMVRLVVAAAFGFAACAHGGRQMFRVSTQGVGSKAGSEVMQSGTTEQNVAAATDFLEGMMATATAMLFNATDTSSSDHEETGLAAQTLGGFMGVLEEASDPNGTLHVRSGVWDLQNMSVGGDAAKAGQQLLKDVLEGTEGVSDGKAHGLHETAEAFGGLLGSLNTSVGYEMADLDKLLAPFGDMGLDQGLKGEGKLDHPSAGLEALANAAQAAEKVGSGDATGNNNPFAALDAFAGALAEQSGNLQKGNLSSEVSNPFEAMGAVAGAMVGAMAEEVKEEISKQGNTSVDNGANLGNPLAPFGDMNPDPALRGKAEDPSAALGAWAGAMATAAEAAEKAESGAAAGKNDNPFAALDAFAGAMAEQRGKAQNSDVSDQASDPFKTVGALVGTMAGAIGEQAEAEHSEELGRPAGQAGMGSDDVNIQQAVGGLAQALGAVVQAASDQEQSQGEPTPLLGTMAGTSHVTQQAVHTAF